MQPRVAENMSNPYAASAVSAAPPKSRQLALWLHLASVLALAAIVVVVAGCDETSDAEKPVSAAENRPDESQPKQSEPVAAPRKTTPQKNRDSKSSEPPLVDDDGKTLWVSPTHGRPLKLAYLSPGAQLIAVLRPAALLKHPEGEKVRAALGPNGQSQIDFVEQTTGVHLADMAQLIIGGQVTSDGKWLVTFVVHATNPISQDALLAKLPGATEKSEDGKTYWLAAQRAYYLPAAGNGKILVVAPTEAIADIIDLAGNPPPLRRDIERLINHTDADRHATIIVAPNSLFSEGQSIFAGELTRLRGPLFWFLGDELSGAALSMNWDENYFLELIATPTLDTRPERATQIFAERLAKVPGKLDQYLKSFSPQPYGNELVSRLPAMVRKLATYTRSGFEPDHAVLRCYLPVVAGHNLLMAVELTLAESPGEATQLAANSTTPGGDATTAATIQERLAKKTSLRFAKDTLEAALEQLSQDIGVPIIIRGPDLQAEGITKNQSFGIDISDKPAEEILVKILRLSNPDKSATNPSDTKQKLVYIIEQKPDKSEQIVVTTRARAAERRNELPTAFRTAKP